MFTQGAVLKALQAGKQHINQIVLEPEILVSNKGDDVQIAVRIVPARANAEKITTSTKDYWAALHPYSLGGAYVNFMMDEGIDRIKATYRDNYDRLVEIKRKYDPDNFFHVNQNIRPD